MHADGKRLPRRGRESPRACRSDAGMTGSQSPVRILVLQLKRIGDLVLTTPALYALRKAGAQVTLVLTDETAALLPLLREIVDSALVYERGRGNIALWWRLLRGRFDATLDFTGRDRSAIMTFLSRARQRIVSRAALRRAPRWRQRCYNVTVDTSVRSRHTADLYLDQLVALDLQGVPTIHASPDGSPAGPVLNLPEGAADRAAQALASSGIDPADDFVVIHPGSARAEKYWLPERWADVIAFCQGELGRPCVLTGGGDAFEEEHLNRIHAALADRGQNCADLSGRVDLTTLAALLARASLFVGVDSGPAHLAAAWRRPQIVLFGPTNPFHWRPRHREGIVFQGGHGDAPVRVFAGNSSGSDMDQISTRAVIDCIKHLPRVAPAVS